MLNAAQCCAADAEWQNQWPVALYTIEVTSKWCTFKFNLSHFNVKKRFLKVYAATLIWIILLLHCCECERNLSFLFVFLLLLLGVVAWAVCLSLSVTFIKLGVLREPCSSEPGTGLFGFDLCRGGKNETRRGH